MNTYYEIINNPLRYISEDRVNFNSIFKTQNVDKVFLNNIIFDLYKLETRVSALNTNDVFWLNHWSVIYKIVFVVGCMAYADRLVWRGQFCKMPPWARHCIRYVPYKINNNIDITDSELITHRHIINEGYSQISSYVNSLPVSISQRLKLLFPHYIDSLIFSKENVISASMLNLVAHYVKNYQN